MTMRSLGLGLALLMLGTLGAPSVARAQTTGETQRISGQRFEALAKRAIASLGLPRDASYVQATPIRDQIVAAGRASLIVESPLATPSYVNVPIDVDLDGSFYRTVFVGYRVQRYVRTAVAAHDLVAGTVIDKADVTVERVPFAGRPGNGTRVLIGRKIVCPFRKGQPVYIEETQVNQIVKPGSSVVLIVNDGGVSVVAEAVARTGGGLGDEVDVYNPSTNRTLSGMVVGPDRVQLDIMGAQ
ncbi:MAG TPA: flagellar basal body P-ring formation chaperone FlgA [Candidatus Baltobacteraceae bacterium]|nr:flagellar basal body P-ring formation chaperone FlgA [Candidatus Baltobacteraceae bacterium]